MKTKQTPEIQRPEMSADWALYEQMEDSLLP